MSLWVLYRISRTQRPVWEKAAVAAALALVGSVYSHAGDQLWLLPLAVVVWPRFREKARIKDAALLGVLIGVNIVVRVISDPFRLSWFSAGYWTPMYLLLGWALHLKIAKRPR